MDASQLLTPTMLELILPMLGWSILLNFVLLFALLFRSFHQTLVQQLQTYWLGIALAWRTVRSSEQNTNPKNVRNPYSLHKGISGD